MYRLQFFRANLWFILDEQDVEVFQGELTACEQWLDQQEHQTRSTQTQRHADQSAWIPKWLRGRTVSKQPTSSPNG